MNSPLTKVHTIDIEPFGVMIPAGTLLMAKHLGTAQAPEAEGGGTYTVLHNLDGSPMIKSELTGKTFHFRWDHLIRFARERGVDAIDLEVAS